MAAHAETIQIETRGRGTQEITGRVQSAVERSGVQTGVATVFIEHTSASLLITENADPQVRRDLERFLSRLIPDGDSLFRHTAEGPDDMPAHVRNVLTETSLNIPVVSGRCTLGTWQGVYVWEHRSRPHRRQVTIAVLGDRS